MISHQDIQKQGALESRLLQIWAQDPPETSTVEEIFGPQESWLLQLGTHRLLLHPVFKEWFYYDRLHDTWERTGFGPGQVEFVARDKILGTRKKKSAVGQPPPAPLISAPPRSVPDGAADGAPAATACPACGAQIAGKIAFCTQCGTPLKAPGPQVAVPGQTHACPACQHRNAPGIKFCVQCGAALMTPGSRGAAEDQKAVCPACHHQNARGTRFCVQCGAQLS